MARRVFLWLAIVLVPCGGFPCGVSRPVLAQAAVAAQGEPEQQTALFYQWYASAAAHTARLCAAGAQSTMLNDPAMRRFVSPALLASLQGVGQAGCSQKNMALSAYFLHAKADDVVGQVPSEVTTIVQTANRALVQVRVGGAALCVRLRHEREGWRLFEVEPQAVAACGE